MPLAIPSFELCGYPVAVVEANSTDLEPNGTADTGRGPGATPGALPLFEGAPRDHANVHACFSAAETAKLERLGVTFSMQGLRFARELADPELRFTWQAISALGRRAPNLKDTARWMIGDWMNAASRGHDEHWPLRIIREEDEFHQFRQRLLELSGTALVALQMLEFTVGVAVRALELSPIAMTTEDVFSPDKVIRGRTLGRLNRELKNRRIFVDDFQERMDCFVELRNRFIHNAWTASFAERPDDHVQRMKALHGLQRLLLSLIRETDAINTVFRGLVATIGESITDQTNSVRDWLDDSDGSLAAFNRVLRAPSEP